MQIKQYDIWLANSNPAKGTEPGKTRSVVIVQTNLLNGVHPSSIICPITSNVLPELEILRVHLNTEQLAKESDILIDQVRAIDNRRLVSKLGELNKEQVKLVKQNLRVVLDL
ncbi:type II toxin-antitoxin system PemK/MazF family toxin [Pedobacter sp. UBA4863]|uniref:type II toxin-antitoxin system PemK/MazF family toxin n=1 Tax=Pedobacter sp. UBA4863 TaxID=1947060 RepID=UPI0025F7272F|nr:type II toxin-antitoxin system PemK/MazF family toxin [Pedobacter sp. UBA4863]